MLVKLTGADRRRRRLDLSFLRERFLAQLVVVHCVVAGHI
jgi:hypothetical protein